MTPNAKFKGTEKIIDNCPFETKWNESIIALQHII